MEYFIIRNYNLYYQLGRYLYDVCWSTIEYARADGNMTPQELIFWVIVGVLVGGLMILIANQLLFNMLQVSVVVNP